MPRIFPKFCSPEQNSRIFRIPNAESAFPITELTSPEHNYHCTINEAPTVRLEILDCCLGM